MIASEARFVPVGSSIQSPWAPPAGSVGPASASVPAREDGFTPSAPPPPADPRALAIGSDAAAAPEPSTVAHRGWRVALLAGLALSGLVGLAGCSPSTPPTSEVSQVATGNPIDVTQATKDAGYVKPSIDPMSGARLDIHRETESHTETDSDGDSHTTTSDVDLSPYGISLGNGLFYDANGNLTFNPYVALCGEPLADAGQVRIDGFLSGQTLTRSSDETSLSGSLGLTARIQGDRLSLPMASDLSVTREGNTTVLHRGPLTSDVRITQEGNCTTISRGLLTSTWTITREGNRITIDQGAFTPSTTIELWENSARMQTTWSTTQVTASEGQVTINRPGLASNTTIQEGKGSLSVQTGLSRQTWTAQ